MPNARDMIFGPGPFVSPCLNAAPRRSLAEHRIVLIARRLDLIRQQFDAKNALARIGRDLAAIDRQLQAIDAARPPELRVIGDLAAVTGGENG